MKNSNYIGIAAAISLIAVCFVPWVFIPSINATLTGMATAQTQLGKPGLLNIFFAFISIILFIIPSTGAKRINVFIAAFNMAWTIRNYLIITQCQMGECPEKRFGIFACIALSFVLLVMTLFPKRN